MDRPLPLPRRAAAEGLAAFALVFAGCGAAVTDAEYDGAQGTLAGGPVTGASMNPARSLGPAPASGTLHSDPDTQRDGARPVRLPA